MKAENYGFTDLTPEQEAAARARLATPEGAIQTVALFIFEAGYDLMMGNILASEVSGIVGGALEEYDYVGDEHFAKTLSAVATAGGQALIALAKSLTAQQDAYGTIMVSFTGNMTGDAEVRIETTGGMTLIAPASAVSVTGGVLAAVWDMRHALIRNPSYQLSVPVSAVKGVQHGA